MTTYKRIGAVKTTLNILRFLSDQKEPVSGRQIAAALAMPHGTVMCYLASMEDGQCVSSIGDKYEIGQGVAYIWARYKANMEGKINRLTNELHQLEV
jgi:DNA-binding IclR family transcriptional regulator